MKKVNDWMNQYSRPLEKHLFDFLFHKGFKVNVIQALEAFQNEDGGFAHGIEPDNLNPFSQPIQTWFAISYMARIKLQDEHPMIKKTVKYLLDIMPDDGLYPAIIPSNNDYPHAIWWTDHLDNRMWGYNPSVALWAFIYRHDQQLKIKKFIVGAMMDFIQKPTTEMHELRCFVDAYEYLYPIRDQFLAFPVFEKTLKHHVYMLLTAYDPLKQTYGLTPLALIDSPNHQLYPFIKEFVDKELEQIKNEIEHHEIWDIKFNWQQYDKSFQKARVTWQSILAVKYSQFLSITQ